MCFAYQHALANMNKWTWHKCCKVACKTLNGLGILQATFDKAVAQWNMVLRTLECFPHPNPYVQRVCTILVGAKKTRIGPEGQRSQLPKSEGDGYKLSAFVSREFGFGSLLTNDELAKINSERRASTATYTNTHAAMEILGTINKPVLTESPFVKYLFIGINIEGYWNS